MRILNIGRIFGPVAALMLAAGAAQANDLQQIVDAQTGVDEARFGALDLDKLTTAARDAQGGPLQVAVHQPVALSARQFGTVEVLPDGRRVWRYRISTANAEHINLAFDWNVPPSTRMYMLNDLGSTPYRAFTFEDNMDHGELWTPHINGSSMELYAEVDADELDAFLDGVSIFKVNLGFMPFETIAVEDANGRSNACHVDVACPEGDPFPDQISGVARYLVNGSGLCSGSLVNNTAEDGTPLFLTAYHCVGSDSNPPGNFANFVAYWNFENSFCRTPGSSASGGNGNGSLADITTGGVQIRARVSTADVALFEFNQQVNPSYNVLYQGWDRRNINTGATVGIHHPSGDEKRISIDNQSAGQTIIDFSDQQNMRVWSLDYDIGGLEGGSSGSPLFNQSAGRVIGVGTAVSTLNSSQICSNQSQFYGRLDYAWTRGTPQTVGQVLDPVGSGSATTLDLLGGGDTLPSTFNAVFPTTGATGVPTDATFDWSSAAFVDTYDFKVTSDFAGNDVVFEITGLTASSYTLPPNAIDGYSNYFWSVSANNANGSTNMSPNSVPFATENAGRPAAYQTLSPALDATDVPVNSTFAWEPAPGADFYQLRVFNDDSGALLWGPADGDINGITFALPFDLPEATNIRWGVIARNSDGFTFSEPTFANFVTEGSVAPDCPGDFDSSNTVDLADLLTCLANFGQSGLDPFTEGDTDGDGDVQLDDLLTVLANFGTSCP